MSVTGSPGFVSGCHCIGEPPCRSGEKKTVQTFTSKISYIKHNFKFHPELLFDPLVDIALLLPLGFSISADDEDENLWHIKRNTEENSVELYGNFKKMTSLTEVVGEFDNKKGEEEDEDSEPEPEKPKKKVTKKESESESESEPEPDDEDVKKV